MSAESYGKLPRADGNGIVRIALAASSYAPYIGGVEEHVRNVARLLQERGHDVVVWTINREGGFDIDTIDGVDVWSLPAPLPARSVASMARFAAQVPRARGRWREALRSHRPDVIHVNCFGPNGTYARYLSHRYRVPMVVSTHGESFMDDAGLFTQSRFAAWSLRRSLAEAVAVTACSQFALDDLVARFRLQPGIGTVVFNGIDLQEPSGAMPEGVSGRYVVSVGRIQRVKGFDLLIDAFARASLPSDIHLVIAGGGPQLENLRAQTDLLHLGDRVTFAGWLDRRSVAALLGAATVGIVPSRVEAFGIAVLEVWRAKTALITTTRGGPPEFVRDGVDGLLVDPEDTDALANAISLLVANDSLAQSLVRAGAGRVQSFTWDRTVDAYESIYQRATDPPIGGALAH